MKRKPTPEKPDWSLSFWFAAFWPLIVVVLVSVGFLAADVINTL